MFSLSLCHLSHDFVKIPASWNRLLGTVSLVERSGSTHHMRCLDFGSIPADGSSSRTIWGFPIMLKAKHSCRSRSKGWWTQQNSRDSWTLQDSPCAWLLLTGSWLVCAGDRPAPELSPHWQRKQHTSAFWPKNGCRRGFLQSLGCEWVSYKKVLKTVVIKVQTPWRPTVWWSRARRVLSGLSRQRRPPDVPAEWFWATEGSPVDSSPHVPWGGLQDGSQCRSPQTAPGHDEWGTAWCMLESVAVSARPCLLKVQLQSQLAL